jgi:hypothetical protein
MKKVINFELAEALARLGCNQKTIATALGFSESGFGNCKAHNEKLRKSLERGQNSLIVDVQEALTNRSFGPAKWIEDPARRARELGTKGADTKCLLYLAEKMEPSTTKIQISGDPNGGPVKSWVEIVERAIREESKKPVEKPKIAPLGV